MATLRGAIFKRGNGTYTALAEPTWDAKQSRYRRPSLGTFKTHEEAVRARLDHNIAAEDGAFSLPGAEQRQIRIDRYLAEWLELIERERLVGKITVRTQRDYETVVRCHIVPYLGRRRIGELTDPMLHRWLLDIRASGKSDRTVQKADLTLHRALADSVLKDNPAKLPKRYRPQVRNRKPAVYPTVSQVDAFVEHVAECGEPYGRRYSVLSMLRWPLWRR